MTLRQNDPKKLLNLFPPPRAVASATNDQPSTTSYATANEGYSQSVEQYAPLSNILQSSLNINEICQLFFTHVQPLIPLDSFTFNDHSGTQKIHCGSKSAHNCSYQLVIERAPLGEISFTRKKRFDENELLKLESLISVLIYPLRNGLLYQDALQTAMTDPLTGLGSRIAMNNSLNRTIGLAQRHDTPFAVLMIDIDWFKKINDSYGHTAGDLVLRKIASAVDHICRQTDQCFRFGGEEFLVILDNTDEETAVAVAQRIRQAVEELEVFYELNAIKVSASIGIATMTNAETATTLIEHADKALYFAKHSGRNQVANYNSMIKLPRHVLSAVNQSKQLEL